MTNLPAGWRMTRLAEVADSALGKMLDRGKDRGYREVPYLRNVNVQWGRIDTHDLQTMQLANEEFDRFAVEPGDLLVCEGGEVGRCAVWSGSTSYLAYQKALHRIRPLPGILQVAYLRYLFEHYARNGELQRHSTGSTIAHLPQQNIKRLPVPLPDYTSQQRIVAVLEDHLSRLDAARTYLDAAKRRLRAEHRAILNAELPAVAHYPAHWGASTVGGVGLVELGRQRHPDWHTGDHMRPYLRVANVFEDEIRLDDVKEMHWPGDTFNRFSLNPGDILLNEGQTPELVGRPAMYRGASGQFAFTNSLIRFVAGPDVLPEFALLVFRRHVHGGRFTQEARITTNIAHLSASRLKTVEFPLPSLAEQQALVDRADDLMKRNARLNEAIDAAVRRDKALRRALLLAAFSGQLTGRSRDLDIAEEMAGDRAGD